MNITIDVVKRYTRLWECFRDEHDKLKKENRELKKRVRDLEDGRKRKITYPKSWLTEIMRTFDPENDLEDPC